MELKKIKIEDLKEDDVLINREKRGWCKNGVFLAKEWKGKWFLLDTYWTNDWENKIDINQQSTLNNFDYVAHKSELERVREPHLYNEEDRIVLAFDSGGYECGNSGYFIKKGTKPNLKFVYNNMKDNIRRAEYELKSAKEDMERFLKTNPEFKEE